MALVDRRERLRTALAQANTQMLRFSEQIDAPPAEVMVAACQLGLEGLIGKRKDSRYVHRRSPEWIKLECGLRQEFVVGGFSKPSGSRLGMSSLLLGVYDKKCALIYAGSVGTGFNDKTLRDLFRRLKPLIASESPFAPSRELEKKAVWVEPKLVVEVSFAEWTSSGSVRHASYRGLRSDKPAASVVRESAVSPPAQKASDRPPATAKLKVTNGDRIIDKMSGATKEALVAYYAAAGDVMLPHLTNRPTSLVRAPAGVAGELFFQKHAESARLQGIKRYPTEINPNHPPINDEREQARFPYP